MAEQSKAEGDRTEQNRIQNMTKQSRAEGGRTGEDITKTEQNKINIA